MHGNLPLSDPMPTSQANYNNPRTEAILSGVERYFNSDTHADVKIYLSGVEFQAHGIILSAQSSYFEKALGCEMKEGAMKKFEYNEGSMQAYWRVFEYMYTGKYSEVAATKLSSIDDDELSKDVRVYQLADYFGIKGLMDYALQNLESKIGKLWVSETFVDVYQSTSDPNCKMRKAIVSTTHKHLKELWEKNTFRELIREGGDFVEAVMHELL